MADEAGLDADVIIIGNDAGGGTLARARAPAGLSIPIFEHGNYLPKELINWDAETVFNASRDHTDESWQDSKRMSIEAVADQAGTLRFGYDPKLSVFDPSCRNHEIDNLYVADASFMPSISTANPSLTIMANALRVADILRHRLAAA